jgi:putative FmdB family regulatory protein
MPIYEYRCDACAKRLTVFFRSMVPDPGKLVCDRCGSRRLSRLVSRVRVLRGGGDAGADQTTADDALMREMGSLDENDPRALGRFMRKMAAETGEPIEGEFEEVIGRLERGEDPEKIEAALGESPLGMDSAEDVSAAPAAGPPTPTPDLPKPRAHKRAATSATRRSKPKAVRKKR